MIRSRRELPPPRELPWPLKPVASAETSLGYDAAGRMVMTIRHDVVAGLTPEMVAWWFANISGDIEIGGQRMSRYLAWHPRDHIHWELARPAPDGSAGVGAMFHIVEAFGRKPEFHIDIIDRVARLDATGISLVGEHLGLQVSELRHDFSRAPGGTLYLSRLTVGLAVPLLRHLNPLAHRLAFTEAMGRAWLQHNVEEVGLLEHIVPLIHSGVL